ncbi:hypothetical protein ACEWY4_011547 [Coilia grayii]|uniref:PDZ and LIM domain-containing protein n=1 Tax=Coilia grayii TaxID=363190 RepID=A0ABD1JXZ7_9TELE
MRSSALWKADLGPLSSPPPPPCPTSPPWAHCLPPPPPTLSNPPAEEPSEILKPVPIAHPPHPHPHPTAPPSSGAVAPAYNKSARPFGGSLGEPAKPPAWAPSVASIPSASSAFTPATTTIIPPTTNTIIPTPTTRPGLARTPTAPHPPPTSPKVPSGCPPPPSIPVVPQPSVYNTPINLYSDDNACEVALGQRRALLDGQGEAPQLNGGPQSVLKKHPYIRAPRRPIIETDIGFYHVPTHGDCSRKRIMEDTEDWRPRTGTSQSRSFRILAQMTGTENEPKKEVDTEKKMTKVDMTIIGPRYNNLRSWHHDIEEPSHNRAPEAPQLPLSNGKATGAETETETEMESDIEAEAAQVVTETSVRDGAQSREAKEEEEEEEEITYNPPSPLLISGSVVSAGPQRLAPVLWPGSQRTTVAAADSTNKPPQDGGVIPEESLSQSCVAEGFFASEDPSGQEEVKRASAYVPHTHSRPEQVFALAPDQTDVSPAPSSLKPVVQHHSPAPLRYPALPLPLALTRPLPLPLSLPLPLPLPPTPCPCLWP